MIPNQPDQTPTLVFNPDIHPHSFGYDMQGENPQEYTVAPLNSIKLPAYLAKKFANQLADAIVNKRGIRTNYQAEKEALLKEILI